MVWMVLTSLKSDSQIYAQSATASTLTFLKTALPHPVMWNNYPDTLKAVPFAKYVRNTLFLCLFSVLGSVFSSALVAYGFSRIHFRCRDAIFYVMICTMALPGQVTMIPMFVIFKSLHCYNTFLPLIIPAFFGSAFYIFLLRQFFNTIPEELSEAARIDGAGEFVIFRQIMLPLAKPALTTCALFQFLWTWNDFFGPLIYLNNQNKFPLAYGLQQLYSTYGGGYTQFMAGAFILTIPIVILFFVFQRTFIQGIATTGLKS